MRGAEGVQRTIWQCEHSARSLHCRLAYGGRVADLSAEALAKAEEGMAEMSKVYDETGRELYMGAGDREHD